MHDERITYVLSINTEELQHTIKNYYGDSFDACRYLDRFFYLRINLPPVDKKEILHEYRVKWKVLFRNNF